MLRYLFRRPGLIIYIFLSLSLLLIKRQPAVTPVVAAPAESYRLTTINGFGGGKYSVGSRVDIWAKSPMPGWVYDTWKGYLDSASDSGSMHLMLTMPSHDLKL